jgi:hypothetical protein
MEQIGKVMLQPEKITFRLLSSALATGNHVANRCYKYVFVSFILQKAGLAIV